MATQTRHRRAQRRSRAVSQEVLRAFDGLRVLRGYFRSDAALCRALRWRPGTVRSWIADAVTRPRRDHREQVWALLALARHAEDWVPDRLLVGDWLLAPQSALSGRSPSSVIHVLGPAEGLDRLQRSFVKIAPRTRVGEPELPSADQLRAALALTLDGETRELVARAERVAGRRPDVSDFD